MSCTDNTCGTGGWGGPQPGDPDNNVSLSAISEDGGINVLWTFPTTNAFAVAYAIIYRGVSPAFVGATAIANDTDGAYFDKVEPGTLYYYWIEVVSIHGTHGAIIGPASARARSAIDQIIRDITGKIDAGVLAQSLKTEIGKIPVMDAAMFKEVQDRINAHLLLTGALDQLGLNVQGAMTLLNEEVSQRTEGQNAMVNSLLQMATLVDDNVAAIQIERQVRSGADDALAQQIQSITANSGDFTAAIQAESTARANGDNALAQQISTTQTTFGNNIASAEQRMDTKITTVNGKVQEIGARYTAKVSVNGLIGGFGVYNDGVEVEAGFDVDLFWIGRTQADKVKPFIIQGGTVYINKAMIGTAYIDTLMIGANQVTIPIGVYTAAEEGYSRPLENIGPQYMDSEVQSAWINSTGAPISVTASAIFLDDNQMYNAWIQIRRDGITLYETSIQNFTTSFSTTIMDIPGAGVHNYQIVLRLGVFVHPYGEVWQVRAKNRTIQLMELKR